MSYMYDPRNRRPSGSPPGSGRPATPTLEDFNKLAQAWREQQQRIESLTQELQAARNGVAIHEDALKRQGDELKKVQSDLIWTQAALAETREKLEAGDGDGWQERFMRLQADVDNLRRRWEQRSTDEIAEARRDILRDMLPLADHLEMALGHSSVVAGEGGAAFVGNIESTLRAFLETLRRHGIEKQAPLGQPFDPERHEAVGQIRDGKTPPGHVAHVVQSGYLDGDKLLRPARVLVSQPPAG
jgi:molecular chaperone GrpE